MTAYILLALLALSAQAHSTALNRHDDFDVLLEPTATEGFKLSLQIDNKYISLGNIGRTFASSYSIKRSETKLELNFNDANLTIDYLYDNERDGRGLKIVWDGKPELTFQDCFEFGTYHWYGGPMQVDQVYPIENAQQNYSPSVITEYDNGAIKERYWLNSAGYYIYVYPEVPLYVDYHNIKSNHICFVAQVGAPYSTKRSRSILSYDFWMLPNAKMAHQHAVDNYLGKPSGLPDYLMVKHPIWSTWAQYSFFIDELKLLDFASQINSYGFKNSQYEIDDFWEVCYGSLTIDETKFPDFAKTVADIKAMGYRVTLWVHPFINMDCEPWYSEALEKGYFSMSESGSPDGLWWNSNGKPSGQIDFTNPDAAEWWYARIKNLVTTYDLDSFKFDAGESSYSPQIPVQSGEIELHPHHIVDTYARVCARFGNMIEVRSAFRTQDLPIFVRMVDRDSIWGLNNGLATLLTTTIQMNLNGYTFVLPDMIGGNGFNLNHDQADLPTKELFIRWVQANVFLPSMQYSYVPWNFDDETVEISRKYTDLHEAYADEIYAAMNASVNYGTPVNPPIWWLDPSDEEALVVWDEILLGEKVLAAPVLEEGATSRDIYLPRGTWKDGNTGELYEGPTKLLSYPAPLDTLPYFILEN